MNAYRFLFMALVMMGVAFSLTYFGPGTDLNCSGLVTPVDISTSDYYEWNQAGATQMDYPGGAFCIEINVDDVIINCSTPSGRGIMNGTANTWALIGVSDGLDNVTIINCHFENATGTIGGIELGENGAGAGVSNIIVDNNYFYNNTQGIFAYNLTDSEIKNNEFEDQSTSAFIVDDYDNLLFEWNDIQGECTGDAAVRVFGLSAIGSEAYIYNNSISNVGIEGIIVWYLEDSEIMDNTISNAGGTGILAYDVRDTVFRGNKIEDNGDIGLFISEFMQEIVAENVYVLHNEVYDNVDVGIFVSNLTNGEIHGNCIYDTPGGGVQEYGLVLLNADPSTISNNEITDHPVVGIYLEDMEDITLQENDIYNNGLGVYLGVDGFAANTGVSFIDNNITDSWDNGMNISRSPGVTLTGNNISDNADVGVALDTSDGAIFQGNYFDNNDGGLAVYFSDDLRVNTQNIFTGHANEGILLNWSDSAIIEDNEFTANNKPIYITDSWYASIDSNDFSGNGYGVLLEDTSFDNVTSNTFDAITWMAVQAENSTDLYVADNTITNANVGIFFDGNGGAHVTDSLIEGNDISNSNNAGINVHWGNNNEITDNTLYDNCQVGGDGAIRTSFSDLMTINDNEVYDNALCDAGIYLLNSDYATIDPNYVYRNDWGIYLEDSHYAVLEGNYIYENVHYGVRLEGSDYALFEGNEFYENALAAIYLHDAENANITDCLFYNNPGSGISASASGNMSVTDSTFYGNAYATSTYAIYGTNADDANISDCTFYDNMGAIHFEVSSNSEFHGITSYDTDADAFYIENCNNFLIRDAQVYNHRAGGYTYYFHGSTGEIYDSVSRDSGADAYGLELIFNSDVNIYNFQIYGNVDRHLFVDASSQIVAENLWIGATDAYGISYETITINAQTDIRDFNTILDEDFISLNSTDTDVAEMSVPANLTTRVSGCSNLKHYNDTADELPISTAEILANGTTFTPEYSTCAGTRATYEVLGFSGFMAQGSSPGGGASLDTMTIVISSNPVTGEELTITVKDSGNPLSNAEVKLRVNVGGSYKYYDLGKTDGAGIVTFTPEHPGNYKAIAEKSGYFDEEKYFSVGSEEETPECTEDSDCAAGFSCVSGKCTKAQPPEEEPADDTGPTGIECVSNMDCPEGYICEENLCIEDVIEEEPEGGPTDEDATQAIYEAEQAIDAAEKEGKDASTAKEYLVLAEQAYAAGDYQAAVDAANEAKTSAEHATVPAAAPTEPTTVPEVISEPVAPEEPPAEEGFPWIWVILGVVIIAALAYWFFTKK